MFVLYMFIFLSAQVGVLSVAEDSISSVFEEGVNIVPSLPQSEEIQMRNVYDAMQKLIEKGLASEVFVKGEKNFKAIHPRRLLELLKEKEERVNKVLPDMQSRYEAVEEEEEAYLYRGIEGFKSYLQELKTL